MTSLVLVPLLLAQASAARRQAPARAAQQTAPLPPAQQPAPLPGAKQPPAPAPQPDESADVRPAGTAGRGYRIGPGDVLQVAVYGHEDLSQSVVVQPGGGFAFPLVGSVAAAGATTEELEARIAHELARGDFLRDARVSVSVREYRSKVVFVVGELARPGTYPLAGETRVVEILSRAGPLAPSAGSEVLVVRPLAGADRPLLPGEVQGGSAAGGQTRGSPAARVLHVDLAALQAGRLDQNVAIQPNDTVFVPRAEQIYVTGEVRNPGAFPFRAGLTARQAVALAGGFTVDASKGGAQLVRQLGTRPQTLKVKLDEPLRPGDTLVIKAAWF